MYVSPSSRLVLIRAECHRGVDTVCAATGTSPAARACKKNESPGTQPRTLTAPAASTTSKEYGVNTNSAGFGNS
jgi:hypothetical protein